MRVLGYVRVSTSEQADSRAGLDAQRAAIAGECERRGWTLVAVLEPDARWPFYNGSTTRSGTGSNMNGLSRTEQEAEIRSKEARTSICASTLPGGAVAVRVAHNPKVAGSNPAPATSPVSARVQRAEPSG